MRKNSEKPASCRLREIYKAAHHVRFHIVVGACMALVLWNMPVFAQSKDDISQDFVIWAHSDIQPRYEIEKYQYLRALDDTKQIFSKIDVVIFAGDIAQFKKIPSMFSWFLTQRKKVQAVQWLEIAGNHDWRDIESYKKMINAKLYYSYEVGNLLFLCLSNEKYGRRTWISDSTFQWWANMVESNQDKIIITVSHGTLEENGLPASRLERLTIEGSERFKRILKKYHVDIWISGHSHFPAWFPNMHVINKGMGNTIFIDIGAIRSDFLTNIESRFLIFKDNSPEVVLRYRDHSNKIFIDGGGYTLILSKKFVIRQNKNILQ